MKCATHMKHLALLEMKCFAKAKHEVKHPPYVPQHTSCRQALHVPQDTSHPDRDTSLKKHFSGSAFSWWTHTDSNRGPPACEAGALTS